MLQVKDIKNTYFNLLSGRIVVNGQDVPVYDTYAPDAAVEPYIILTVPSMVQMTNTICDTYEVMVNVDVVTKFIHPMGMGMAETIAGEVDDIIRPSRMDQIAGVGDTTISNVRPMNSKDGQKYVYRQIITYNHVI